MREFTLRLGRTDTTVQVDRRTVVLVDDAARARTLVDALAAGGLRAVHADDGGRGTVQDLLPRRADASEVERVRAALHLDDDVLQWRLRDSGPLHRLLAASFVALASGADGIVVDLSAVAASAFDAAHACSHLRRAAESLGATVVAVVPDAALLSSAGTHLVVVAGDAVVESGPVASLLAQPQSDALVRRLEATPVPNPMAMQMRRVQRVTTRPVNYAHTTIIDLPTQDSVALAGGEDDEA